MSWPTDIDTVFTKCITLPFFIHRLRYKNVDKTLMANRFGQRYPCNFILHVGLRFPGLLYIDLTSSSKCFRLLSTSSGAANWQICKMFFSQHFHSCKRLSSSNIKDPLHSIRPYFANALLTSNTRSSFGLVRFRKSLYRNSFILSPARHLVFSHTVL